MSSVGRRMPRRVAIMRAILGRREFPVELRREQLRGVALRVVFFGSPEFAVPTLQSLAASPAFEVALVVTQAAKGRSPVEVAAERTRSPGLQAGDAARSRITRAADRGRAGSLRGGGVRVDLSPADARHSSPGLDQRPSLAAAQVPRGEPDRGRDRGGGSRDGCRADGDGCGYRHRSCRFSGAGAGCRRRHERIARGPAGADRRRDGGAGYPALGRGRAGCLAAAGFAGESDANADQGGRLDRLDASRRPISSGRFAPCGPGRAPGRRSTDRRSRSTAQRLWPWSTASTSLESSFQRDDRLIVACGEDALEIQTVEPAGRRTMAASAYLERGAERQSFGSEMTGAPEPVPPLIVPVET